MKKPTAALLLLLGVLIGAPIWVGVSALATDISTSDWSETDASNNQTAPAGFPEGMAPSAVNNAARAVMGASKRFWNRINGTVTASGSSGVYALSYTVAPSTYVNGETYSFKANHTNTSTGASLNINSLGAKTIVKPSTNGLLALGASDIATSNRVSVQYDSATDQFVVVSGLPQSAQTTFTGSSGVSVSGSAITLDISGLTTLASPATDDVLPIYDTSATANRGISLQALLSIVNVLTETTSVESSSDYLLMYDTSASGARKIKPSNLFTGFSVVSATRYEASTTYTKPSGLQYALVIAVGGGGGGGAGASGVGAGGSGGSSGGVGIRLLAASAIGATESVTIGTGGSAASAGNASSFGTLVTGGAGAAGAAASGTTPGQGAAGGVGSGTDTFAIRGGPGDSGSGIAATSGGKGGTGGSNIFGGGGTGGVGNSASGTAGGNGQSYGGGGGGGGGGDAGAGSGSSGADGVVWVLEFKSS